MSTILSPAAAAYMYTCLGKVFHEPELKGLAESFVEYKQTTGGLFGTIASLHCRMFGGSEQLAAAAAAAAEFMILSLDIYDDLQDQDNESVPWAQVSPALALNVAIGLQALSIDVLMDLPIASERIRSAVNALNQGILHAVNGQHKDLLNDTMTEEQCLAMIESKSGALVAATCLVGTALITGEHHELVERNGRSIGVAAQIKNDIEGIKTWSTRNDMLARKQTLPIQFVLEQQSEEAAAVRSYYDGTITREQLLSNKHGIMDFIHSCGCIEYALILARLKQYESESAIAQLPIDDAWKEELRSFF